MISIGRSECTLSNNICYTCEFSLVIERCSLVVVSIYSAGRSAGRERFTPKGPGRPAGRKDRLHLYMCYMPARVLHDSISRKVGISDTHTHRHRHCRARRPTSLCVVKRLRPPDGRLHSTQHKRNTNFVRFDSNMSTTVEMITRRKKKKK
jgi:hypothetical protein